MTKTKRIKKAAAVLMAAIMTFAVLGVTALGITTFSAPYVKFFTIGSVTNMSLKVEYNKCNSVGIKSDPAKFTLNNKNTCYITFTTSSPSAKYYFYKNNEGTPSAAFTTPTYVSGMPSTLSSGIELEAGTYTVTVKSASQLNTVSGYFTLSDVSSVSGAQ